MNKRRQIEDLIQILEESNISSLEVSSFWGFRKIKLSKEGFSNSNYSQSDTLMKESSVSTARKIQSNRAEASPEENQESVNVPDLDVFTQKAPLVGTIYLSPNPEDPSFVKEGDVVKKGQKICLIEAMKIFNEIEAEQDGIVCEILVKNEDPVEFGQAIIKIKS